METHHDQDTMNLFINVLADMINHYIDAEQERQLRASFWLNFLNSHGMKAEVVVA